MSRYLLDTSTLSALGRPGAPPKLLRRLELRRAACAVPSMAVAELVFGAARHPDPVRRARLEQFVDELLAVLPVVPFDQAAAEWLGRRRALLEARGIVVDLADLVIASTAAAHDLVVVTANVRHFEATGTEVEDWTAL